MLHNLTWLAAGQPFPPLSERDRIKRYVENEALFDGEHFGEVLRTRDKIYSHEGSITVYQQCADRISQVVGNFEEVVSFPVLLNYQRLMSLKMADLVCGEYPNISGATSLENQALKEVRDYSDFDERLYATVIDISRYGDAIWRTYLDWSGRKTFTCWDPKQWYPVVSQDGTNTITAHVLCWRENLTETADGLPPDWRLHAQIHWCGPERAGTYTYKVFKLDDSGSAILAELSSTDVLTGMDTCSVIHLKAFSTTTTVYGYDDYMPIDSLLAEIMTRVGQISVILDKHADPNITGPASMLTRDPVTGEYHLRTGKFFATSPGENPPEYMTWDGQLTAAFKELETLLNQLYILSEMGAAVLGGQDGSATAISGTAMRFKMVNPLAKARRIANSLTLPVRKLFSELSSDAEVEVSSNGNDSSSTVGGGPGNVGNAAVQGGAGSAGSESAAGAEQLAQETLTLPIPYKNISVFWADGLPDDPRENIESCKLASGATKMMPLKKAIMEYFGRSDEEAEQWLEMIRQETEDNMVLQQEAAAAAAQDNPNHAGPQDGTGVDPRKKGSETGLRNFHSPTNGGADGD